MSKIGSFVRRNNISIGFTIIAIALGTMLFILASASAKLQQEQVTTQQILSQGQKTLSELDSNSKDRTAQINQLTTRLNCMFQFFSTGNPDRADKAIADIDTCTISNINGSGTTTKLNSQGTLVVPPTTQQSQTPAAQAPTNNPQSTPSTPSQPSSGGSGQPGFLRRDLINPIKNLINDL